MAVIKSGLFMKLGTSLLSKESLGSLKKRKETKTVNTPGRILDLASSPIKGLQ